MRVAGIGHDRMQVAGGGFDRDMAHQLAEGIDTFARVGGIGMPQHMRGDQPIQPRLAGSLANGALQQIMQQADLSLDQP